MCVPGECMAANKQADTDKNVRIWHTLVSLQSAIMKS